MCPLTPLAKGGFENQPEMDSLGKHGEGVLEGGGGRSGGISVSDLDNLSISRQKV